MALTPAQEEAVGRAFCRCASQVWDEWATPTPTKAEIVAAVAAADQWQDDEQISYMTALPQPFRGASTGAQKVLMFIGVACARYLVDNPDAVEFLSCLVARLEQTVSE